MNKSTEHILQCNQSEPLADGSGMIVDQMNENVRTPLAVGTIFVLCDVGSQRGKNQ